MPDLPGTQRPARLIMLTSFEEFDYIKQAMGAGVVDYLVKLD